jgi:hypothetical protein
VGALLVAPKILSRKLPRTLDGAEIATYTALADFLHGNMLIGQQRHADLAVHLITPD